MGPNSQAAAAESSAESKDGAIVSLCGYAIPASQQGLHRYPFPALGPATLDHATTGGGALAFTETVNSESAALFWLVGPFWHIIPYSVPGERPLVNEDAAMAVGHPLHPLVIHRILTFLANFGHFCGVVDMVLCTSRCNF